MRMPTVQHRCDRSHAAASGVLVLMVLLALAACSTSYTPGHLGAGATEPQLVQRMGPPNARHTLADGVLRLEFARGPMGKHTYMADMGADGRVVRIRQVLQEHHLMAAVRPGLPRAQLLQEIGRPAEQRSGGWAGGQVWAWRYDTFDCRWFVVSLNDQHVVSSSAFSEDPMCADVETP